MYDVDIESLGEDLISVVLKRMWEYVRQENFEIQQRYENIMMLSRQCIKYEDKSMIERIKSMILELNDDLMEGYNIREHCGYEYILRENSRVSEDMLTAALSRTYDTRKMDKTTDAELIVLFRQIWLSGKTSTATINALRDFLQRENDFVVTLVCYAIMLRCQRYYDKGMVRLLMETKTPEAYTALAMIFLQHFKRILYDSCEKGAFVEFIADKKRCERFVKAIEYIHMTHETKVIAEEFQEKIYPEVMKKRADLNIDQMMNQGKQPDWEGLLGGSPLMNKMRKINDMQLKGKDVSYATFKEMKRYSFFSETAHWFYPFTLRYHTISVANGLDEKGLDLVMRLSNLCDSDRYSLFLMFNSMGVKNIEAALGEMGMDKLNDLKDMVEDNLKSNKDTEFMLRLRYSVMNIYRFYTLAPNSSDFISPLTKFVKESVMQKFKKILPVEIIGRIADACFDAMNYQVATILYESCVDELIDSDIRIYQKMGYCHEQMENYAEAIEYYDKSDVLLPDDAWTIRRMLLCHAINLCSNGVLIKLYRRLLAIEPDDTDVMIELAKVLYKEELYNDANTLLYKVEYANPCCSVWDLMGQSLTKSGKLEDAAKFFDKACKSKDAEPSTFVFAAINSLLIGDDKAEGYIKEAYMILNNTNSLKLILQEDFVKWAVEQMNEEQRYKLTNIINKIIIES